MAIASENSKFATPGYWPFTLFCFREAIICPLFVFHWVSLHYNISVASVVASVISVPLKQSNVSVSCLLQNQLKNFVKNLQCFLHRRVSIGLFCSTPAVAIARSLPRKIAMQMLLTAEPISAQGTTTYLFANWMKSATCLYCPSKINHACSHS